MKFGVCKLCGQSQPLAKAHIIPRSFLLRAKGPSSRLEEARSYDSKKIQYWQNGVWDHNILCHKCEASFSAWDSYAFQLLGTPPGKETFPSGELELEEYVLKQIDYPKLKLFVLSFLWRASVTSEPFFSRIKLGSHEQQVRTMLRKRDPGKDDAYPFVLFRFVEQRFPNLVIAPQRQRYLGGVNWVLLYLPRIRICVKVDNRPVDEQSSRFMIRPGVENRLLPTRLKEGELECIARGAEIFRSQFKTKGAT